MKKILLLTLMFLLVAATAFAGPMEAVKGWFSWTAAAFILSGLLALGVIGKYTPWLSKFLIAVGALITGIGLALADGKVTVDELKEAKENLKAVRLLLRPPKAGDNG